MSQELEQVKQCIKCQEIKPLTQYYKNGRGLRHDCKACNIKKSNFARLKRQGSTIETYLFEAVRSNNSSKRDRFKENNLTVNDIKNQLIKQNYKCYWTGVDLTLDANKFRKPSLDRLNNDIGYLSDNIVVTIWAINRMRSNLDADKFKVLLNEVMTTMKDVS